jgi:uncharacterized membrane protein
VEAESRPVSEYELALLVHLLGVAVLAAGMGVAAAAFEAGRRRTSAREVALLLRLTRAGVGLVATGTLVLLVGGFWLMEVGLYDLGDGWLAASLGLFVLGALLGTLGGARSKRARLYAEGLAGDNRQSMRRCDGSSTTGWRRRSTTAVQPSCSPCSR